MACLSEAATPKIGIKFCACVGWRRLLYNSVEQRRDSACQCSGTVLEKGAGWAISGLRSVAHAHDTYGVCTMPTVHVHHLAVYLRWFTDDWAPADTRAWLRIIEQEVDSRQPTDGRGCREKWRGDRLEMYGHGRLPTLTDAYRSLPTLIPGAGLLLLPRVTVSIRTPVWLGLYFTQRFLLIYQSIPAGIHKTSQDSISPRNKCEK